MRMYLLDVFLNTPGDAAANPANFPFFFFFFFLLFVVIASGIFIGSNATCWNRRFPALSMF